MDTKDEIIVNADDFGRSQTINKAISQCFALNIIQRTSIMVNMPYYKEAILIAKEENFFDKIGLHINLMEGEPLTESIKLFPEVCSNGIFNGQLQSHLRSRFFHSSELKKAIKEEIEAQIKVYINEGFPLLHLDSHFHIHNEAFIYNIIKPLSLQYGIKSMRIARNLMPQNSIIYFIKSLYKYILNSNIKKNFKHTSYFGSYQDFNLYYKHFSVEIMVHPELINGELVDIVDHNFIPFSTYYKIL